MNREPKVLQAGGELRIADHYLEQDYQPVQIKGGIKHGDAERDPGAGSEVNYLVCF